MSSTKTIDILLLGCTGLTGRLTTRYLLNHPRRDSFTFAVTARTQAKADRVLQGLGATGNDAPKVIVLDVTNEDQVDAAVAQAKAVINTCGPYWLYGTPVIRACVKHRTHCVDLAGEPYWVRTIIDEFHETAERDGTTLVSACGFDSIPSDFGAFMGAKALKDFAGPETELDSATSIFKCKGGISKGTLNTTMTREEALSDEIKAKSQAEFYLSPVKGIDQPEPQTWYTLADPEAKDLRIGAFFPMIVINRPVVQRTWGLLEQGNDAGAKYGSKFKYNEWLETGSRVSSIFLLLGTLAFLGIAKLSIGRSLLRKYLPDGVGVSDDETLEAGWFCVDTYTKSLPDPGSDKKPIYAKTTFKGKGDPGYLLTSAMLAEGALILLFGEGTKRGGVITPVLAFGETLPQKLRETGRMEMESHIMQDDFK